jgi:hypothetical protein
MTEFPNPKPRPAPQTKAELREMLAQAVRNTHSEETKPPAKAKKAQA